jgi:predicted MFS family arabinose efflux permease
LINYALTAAAASVSKEEAPKAVSKVMLGVTAGIVIGSPVTTFIANTTSFEMAMLFFTIVNAIAFFTILLFVPSMPVKERLSYGSQLSVLKKSITWHPIIAVVFIYAAVYGVNSYLSEYLETITNIPGKTVSLMLLIYGGASIIGNIVAGKLLTKNPMKSVASYPFVLGAVFILVFVTGKFAGPMFIFVLVWGIVVALANNISQLLDYFCRTRSC